MTCKPHILYLSTTAPSTLHMAAMQNKGYTVEWFGFLIDFDAANLYLQAHRMAAIAISDIYQPQWRSALNCKNCPVPVFTFENPEDDVLILVPVVSPIMPVKSMVYLLPRGLSSPPIEHLDLCKKLGYRLTWFSNFGNVINVIDHVRACGDTYDGIIVSGKDTLAQLESTRLITALPCPLYHFWNNAAGDLELLPLPVTNVESTPQKEVDSCPYPKTMHIFTSDPVNSQWFIDQGVLPIVHDIASKEFSLLSKIVEITTDGTVGFMFLGLLSEGIGFPHLEKNRLLWAIENQDDRPFKLVNVTPMADRRNVSYQKLDKRIDNHKDYRCNRNPTSPEEVNSLLTKRRQTETSTVKNQTNVRITTHPTYKNTAVNTSPSSTSVNMKDLYRNTIEKQLYARSKNELHVRSRRVDHSLALFIAAVNSFIVPKAHLTVKESLEQYGRSIAIGDRLTLELTIKAYDQTVEVHNKSIPQFIGYTLHVTKHGYPIDDYICVTTECLVEALAEILRGAHCMSWIEANLALKTL